MPTLTNLTKQPKTFTVGGVGVHIAPRQTSDPVDAEALASCRNAQKAIAKGWIRVNEDPKRPDRPRRKPEPKELGGEG